MWEWQTGSVARGAKVNPLCVNNRQRSKLSTPVTLRHRTGLDVFQDDRIRANLRMGSNLGAAKNFRSGADVDMTSDFWEARSFAAGVTDRHLLKYQTIYANLGSRMNDNAVRVRDQQSSSDLAIEWDVSTSGNRPKTMAQDDRLADACCKEALLFLPVLIAADCEQELSPGVPKPGRCFTTPVGNFGAYVRRSLIHGFARTVFNCTERSLVGRQDGPKGEQGYSPTPPLLLRGHKHYFGGSPCCG